MFACLYRSSRSTGSRRRSARSLIRLAHEHSPRVEVHGPGLVVLDVSGLRHMWGSPHEVGERLRRVAAEQYPGVRVGVAGTKMAALLVTQTRRGLTVIPCGSEAKALSVIPLTVLNRPSLSSLLVSMLVAVPVVQRWGIKTLGELAGLPSDELFSRLGRAGLELQRVARGEDGQPLVPESDEEPFEQAIALEWPVEGLEPLSFVLGRVLEPLCEQLGTRGVAAGGLHVRLTLVSRETHERTLQFPAAVNDPKILRALILLDLESHPPSAGVDRVMVAADPVPARTLQFSLLERAVPSAERLSTLLARLTVLIGDRRCGAPGLVDTHQPGAFSVRPFMPRAKPPQVREPAWQNRGIVPVLRRFRTPALARVVVEQDRPVRVSTGRQPSGDGRVITWAGPWRSSGQWWQTPWDRDEWDVELSDGALYRIFRDRTSDRWFVEGVMD